MRKNIWNTARNFSNGFSSVMQTTVEQLFDSHTEYYTGEETRLCKQIVAFPSVERTRGFLPPSPSENEVETK
jgi:hypothetical protein